MRLPCELPQPRSAPSFSFVCPSFPLRWCLRLSLLSVHKATSIRRRRSSALSKMANYGPAFYTVCVQPELDCRTPRCSAGLLSPQCLDVGSGTWSTQAERSSPVCLRCRSRVCMCVYVCRADCGAAAAAAGQASEECNNQVKGQTLRRNATKQRPGPTHAITTSEAHACTILRCDTYIDNIMMWCFRGYTRVPTCYLTQQHHCESTHASCWCWQEADALVLECI